MYEYIYIYIRIYIYICTYIIIFDGSHNKLNIYEGYKISKEEKNQLKNRNITKRLSFD